MNVQVDKGLLLEILGEIEDLEVAYDKEFGGGDDIFTLIKDDKMPECYHKLAQIVDHYPAPPEVIWTNEERHKRRIARLKEIYK